MWIRVRVRCGDLAIFEKVECGCGRIRLLINYLYLYFIYIAKHIFSYDSKHIPI